MKKLSVLGVLLALVLTFSIVVPAQAAPVYRYNESIDLNGALLGFEFEGPLHVNIVAVEDRSGGFHLKVGLNSQGIKAVRYDGTVYNVIASIQGHLNSDAYFAEPPLEATLVINLKLVGQGTAPDYRAHGNFHITLNADGEMTAAVWNIVWNLPYDLPPSPF